METKKSKWIKLLKFALFFLVLTLTVFSCKKENEESIKPAQEEILNRLKATTISITNPGFESNWDGWTDVDPSAISSVEHTGDKSAKITGSGGKFTQDVNVTANTNYVLSAFVSGSWRIGAIVNGIKTSRSGTASDWKEESVSFNSGSATTITIIAEYYAGEGRYDDFSLTSDDGTIDPAGEGDVIKLPIYSVIASDDDGNIPENTLDGDLSTRWSAEGDGQWIQYDLGTIQTVKSVKIAWYKGDSRTSDFEIMSGTSTSDLNVVYTGISSGTTLDLEEYSFTSESARYIRIVGYGNSSNAWNSITEFEIYGTPDSSVGSDTIPPSPVANLTAIPDNSSVSLSWTNPTDSDFDHVVINYAGGSNSTSATSITIAGLTNGTEYTFYLIAYDNAGNASTEAIVSATPVDNGGSIYPVAALGITPETWKINSFTGEPGPDAVYWDDITDAGIDYYTYSDDNYFYTDGTWTYFKCYRGLGTSENSENPRVELREMTNGQLASWDGNIGTNSMEWTVRVEQLPMDADGSGGILCFGQIHGPSGTVDDVIRVQFLGEENQSTGPVRLKISGYITEKVQGSSLILDLGYQLDTEYTFKITYTNGTIYLYEGGSLIFSETMNTNTGGNYFKAGNYLQSVQNATYTGSYGLVAIKNLTITHN